MTSRQATDILEEAGYEVGDTLTLDGEQIGPFRIRGGDTEPSNIAMQLIQSYLGDLGIGIDIQTTDDLGTTLMEADYDLMVFGWSGSPFFTSSPDQFWHSDVRQQLRRVRGPRGRHPGRGRRSPRRRSRRQRVRQRGCGDRGRGRLRPADARDAGLPVRPGRYGNVRDNPSTSLRGLYNNHQWGLVATE